MKKTKYLAFLCAVICLITALSVSASAAGSVTDQMAANSAAWYIAKAAGDTAACEALHEANVALANSAASGGGSASYNSASGTWNITTSSGSTISSSGSSNGKSSSISYTTTTSSGSISSSTDSSYTDSSIGAYKNAGGTNSGLQTAYNNDAQKVSSTGAYGNEVAVSTAASEAAVAKALLGLTDSQAQQLQKELEASKNTYVTAKAEYNDAVKSGNTAAANEAKAKMDAAHDKAQATRDNYGYTGDSDDYTDGGYYYGDGKTESDGGGFYVSDITQSYRITATAGEGGAISPSGTVNVKKNDSQSYTITPASGYDIERVTVDSVSKGAVSSYTFSNVTGPHTISASFKPNGEISIGGVGITDALGADLSGGTIKSGYGIFASVSGSHSGVTNAAMTMTYNFGQGSKTVTLQETSAGVFSFPKNSDSPTNKRCVYIPVETKDGSYTLTLTFTAKNAAGESLTETKTATITVRGTMYEDDFTGNS